MFAFSAALVTLAGIASGIAVGSVFGFSFASHRDVMAGFRPRTGNRFIRWLARPTREFRFGEALILLVVILCWLFLFFVLCAIPVLAAVKLDGEGSPLIAYSFVVFAASGYGGLYIGRRLWTRYAQAAV